MNVRPTKELVGASSALLVLGVLAQQSSYGYDIVKRINDAADGLFRWQEGTIYPLLHRLEKEELIRSRWQESESGRERKYYYITARGPHKHYPGPPEQWRDFNALVVRIAGLSNG